MISRAELLLLREMIELILNQAKIPFMENPAKVGHLPTSRDTGDITPPAKQIGYMFLNS